MSTKLYALRHKLIWILALCPQVHCDWVEISQNHYTKPVHDVVGTFEITTVPNRKYINQSLTERTWNRGVVDKVSYVGNIRRVPYASVKTTALKTRNGEENEHFVDHADSSTEKIFISIRPNANTHEELTNKSNIISEQDTASVARFRDVKPSVSSKKIPVQSSIVNSFTQRKILKDTIEVLGIDKRNRITNVPSAETTNKNKKIFNVDASLNDDFYSANNPQINRNFDVDKVKLNDRQNVNITKASKSPKIKLIYRVTNGDSSEGEFKDNNVNKEDTNSGNTEHNLIHYLDIIKYKSHRPQGHIESVTKFSYPTPAAYIDKNEHNTKTLNKSDINNINVNHGNDIPFLNKSDKIILQSPPNEIKFQKSKDVPNAANENTKNGIWKLMKLVTDIIYKNTHRSFNSKIKYLERLKTTILTSIEDQIDITWPDDALPTGTHRHTRSAQARSHLEFPSSESTLMTISFLTFAVFLIKLVLQVIHTYKNKTMMVAPTVVAAVGRAAAAFKHHYHQ